MALLAALIGGDLDDLAVANLRALYPCISVDKIRGVGKVCKDRSVSQCLPCAI